jgi:hypothetical protein
MAHGSGMARPSTYRPELAETICARLEAGEPLAQICRDAEMPGVRTVLRWADENEEFADQYRRAQQAQAEQLDARIDEIARTAVDKDSAAAARVQITALIWRASKQAPKKYGDRLDVTSNGEKLGLAAELEAARRRVADKS